MKRNMVILFFIALLISASLFSCSPAYVPSVMPTPLFKENPGIEINNTYGASGMGFQFNTTVSDNIAIVSQIHSTAGFEIFQSDSRKTIGEAGVGYFYPLGDIGSFEVFAGGGGGWMKQPTGNPVITGYPYALLFKGFLQPNIGVSTDFADICLSSRLSLVSLRHDSHSVSRVFLEPAITLRLNMFRLSSLYCQLGTARPLTKTEHFDFQQIFLTIGYGVNL